MFFPAGKATVSAIWPRNPFDFAEFRQRFPFLAGASERGNEPGDSNNRG